MQAITVKYMSATKRKGSRFKAICQAGSITVPYDYGHPFPAAIAMQALCRMLDDQSEKKYGSDRRIWSDTKWIAGETHDGLTVFVSADDFQHSGKGD